MNDRTAAPTRTTMHCRRCSYPLDGLDSRACPECGTAFDPANRRTWRRHTRRFLWLRRAVMVVLCLSLAAGAFMGWVAWRDHTVRRDLTRIQNAGGDPGFPMVNPHPLARWIGEDHLRSIDYVSFQGGILDDRAMAQLPGVRMQYLHLIHTSVTDAGLADIARVRGLRRLEFTQIKTIDGSGLAHLVRLPRLESLYLDSTVLDGRHLAHLGRLRRLQSLTLRRYEPGDIQHLPPLATLEHLSLDGPSLSEADLRHIAGFPKLTSVALYVKSLSDDDLALLAPLDLHALYVYRTTRCTKRAVATIASESSLAKLWIYNTGLQDDDLAPLANLQSLEELSIVGRPLTGDCLRHVAALPRLRKVMLASRQAQAAIPHLQRMPALQEVEFLDHDNAARAATTRSLPGVSVTGVNDHLWRW